MEDLKGIIRDIPDFPKKGIVFKDITNLLADAGRRRVLGEKPQHQPHVGEVRQPVDRLPLFDVLAFDGQLFDHRAGVGRIEVQPAVGPPGVFELFDLRRRHSQLDQLLPGAFREIEVKSQLAEPRRGGRGE